MGRRSETLAARAYRLTTKPIRGEDLIEVEPGFWVPRYQTEHAVDPFVSAKRYLSRMPDWFDIRGKRVLDVGCGSGHLCIEMARRGAKVVVGIEVTEDGCEIARATLRKLDPELPIDYRCTGGDLNRLGGEQFDVVVSKDSFEHYGALPGSPSASDMVRDMGQRLDGEGYLAIGFGPPWKAPYGGHIDTKLPWAHLLFPEDVIFDEFRRVRQSATARTFEEGTGVNRMTLSRFKEIMAGSGLTCLSFATNVSDRPAAKVMRGLARVPPLKEYFTNNIYSVWSLGSPGSVASGSAPR